MDRNSMFFMVGVAGIASMAAAQITVEVNDGQTLTEADLVAGVFDGQPFTLDTRTTFEVNGGGTFGPAGDFPDGFDFNLSIVNINGGGFFASTDPDPGVPFVQTNARNIQINVFDGGQLGENFFLLGESTITFEGGDIVGNLALFDDSSAIVRGGVVGPLFTAFAGTSITISGGIVEGDLVGTDFSEITISGGVVGDVITVFGDSVTTISGGSIGNEFVAFDDAIVDLIVRDLRIDGVPIDLTLGVPFEVTQRGGELLEATLADGTPFDLVLNTDFGSDGDVIEPGAVLSVSVVEPDCRADLDGDGELTLFDFLALQNAFDSGQSVADFDGDGSLTLFDFLAFQDEFDAGCP